jgi:hypothetical protein
MGLIRIALILLAVTSCAPPRVQDIVKDGFTCHVEIRTDPIHDGETIKVDAKFSNCREE